MKVKIVYDKDSLEILGHTENYLLDLSAPNGVVIVTVVPNDFFNAQTGEYNYHLERNDNNIIEVKSNNSNDFGSE